MSVHIITDSASDIREYGPSRLTVLPLTVAFGDTVYRDGVDLPVERFYEMLIEGNDLPTTGQVNPYAYSQAIEAARAEGADEILIVTLSGKLSGTNQSANIAALEAGGEAAGVYVVDSKSVTVGEQILVRAALGRAEEGWAAADIVRELESLRERVCLVALLETLEYLRRGGRVPAATAVLGTLLSIKPVVAVVDGEVVLRGKARGSKNGRNLLNQEIEQAGGADTTRPVALAYSGLSDHLLQKYIEDSRALWEGKIDRDLLEITCVGATIGTHVGPGAIALAFFKA